MRRARPSARAGFTLIELLVVVVIIGILASVAMPSFAEAQDRARNAAVQANVQLVRTAMENYASDHNGLYPQDGDLASEESFASTVAGKGFMADNYLPGNKVPRSPWCPEAQDTIVATQAGTPATGTGYYDGTTQYPVPGTPLGLAGAVAAKPTMAQHYGAMPYDARTSTRLEWVLYGIGKRKNQAIIALTLGVSTP